MVTGKQTFRKQTSVETMTAILNEDPQSIAQLAPSTPPGVQRIMHRCWRRIWSSVSTPPTTWPSRWKQCLIQPSPPRIAPPLQKEKSSLVRTSILAATAAAVLGGLVLAYFWTRPQAIPKVSDYVQLTHDGQRKQLVATDGSRLDESSIFLPCLASELSDKCAGRILIATVRFRRVSSARYTSPMPPAPSGDSIS